MIKRLTMFVKFMMSGAPAFFLAMFFNFVLVTHLNVPIAIAYCLILFFQLLLNYVIVKLFVFKTWDKLFDLKELFAFFSGVLSLRLADFLLYIFLTVELGLYFMYVQVGNMILFSIARYWFAEKIFIKKQ